MFGSILEQLGESLAKGGGQIRSKLRQFPMNAFSLMRPAEAGVLRSEWDVDPLRPLA